MLLNPKLTLHQTYTNNMTKNNTHKMQCMDAKKNDW